MFSKNDYDYDFICISDVYYLIYRDSKKTLLENEAREVGWGKVK